MHHICYHLYITPTKLCKFSSKIPQLNGDEIARMGCHEIHGVFFLRYGDLVVRTYMPQPSRSAPVVGLAGHYIYCWYYIWPFSQYACFSRWWFKNILSDPYSILPVDLPIWWAYSVGVDTNNPFLAIVAIVPKRWKDGPCPCSRLLPQAWRRGSTNLSSKGHFRGPQVKNLMKEIHS